MGQSTTRRTAPGQAVALTYWSADQLLRVHPATALTDEELAPHLAGLLSAVGQELEAGRASVPTTVRCAAVQLATHITRRWSIPGPPPGGAGEPVERTAHRADHATGIPFSRSIRLGRMG